MRLDQLLPARAPGVLESPDLGVEISGLAYDSRRVAEGTLFFCVPGQRSDGHHFAEQALSSGAAALVVQRPLGLRAPEVLVRDARVAMAQAAVRFHRDPTSRLRVIGVTGTNGKTTTSFLVRALIESLGQRCGLLGTVKSIVGGIEREAGRTTPEAIDLQADFAEMLAAGESACAIEVSSHALQLRRTDGVRFAAAIFTNLTQDHLDFHRTMEAYFQAKRRLFVGDGGAPAPARRRASDPGDGGVPAPGDGGDPPVKVVNVGDPYGRRLAQELRHAVTFGVDVEADYAATHLSVSASSTSARLHTPQGERMLTLPLPGRFNVENALGALAAVHQLHGELDVLIDTLQKGVGVPGRFEPVDQGQDFAVIVDYAHTPDSLENVLSAARQIASGRLLCVFGAGGDRDRGKRPLMGEVGARLADVVLLTSDNPRSEDPHRIIEDVLDGVRAGGHSSTVHVTPHRGQAISQAIHLAEAGDVIVIAGKGHEQGIELAGGVKIPFDDVSAAKQALRARGAAGGPSLEAAA